MIYAPVSGARDGAGRGTCGKLGAKSHRLLNASDTTAIVFPGEFMSKFNGLGLHLGNLALLSTARTRAISPENPTGEPGQGARASEGTGADAARDLGPGWKVSPSIHIEPGQTVTLAHIEGSGAIQQIWMTPTGHWRHLLLRAYWDGHGDASIATPLGDFFGMGWGEYDPLNSAAVCVNPASGFNCYWEMPFKTQARITLENVSQETVTLYYQINYTLTEVEPERGAWILEMFM